MGEAPQDIRFTRTISVLLKITYYEILLMVWYKAICQN